MPKASWGDTDGSLWEEELDGYAVYDGEQPPKGMYRCALKFLRLKTNKNDQPMLNGMLIINEPSGSKKAQYNGYDFWFNLNVTNQGARWVNNFLTALVDEKKSAALRKAFWEQKVMIDKSEPPTVLSIGILKIVENMLVTAVCKLKKEYGGEGLTLDPTSFSRPADLKFNSEGAQTSEPDGEDDEGWESDEEDPEIAAREEELAEMNRNQLLKIAKELEVSVKRGTPEADIIEAILDVEFPFEDEDEEGDEEPEEEEEEEEEEIAEEEPEPEPEPAKPARRRSGRVAATKAAPPAEEAKPAARTRTGTRRSAGTKKPPF